MGAAMLEAAGASEGCPGLSVATAEGLGRDSC